eukprot:COSAG05_NODE_349_length_10936_cov_9.714404_2_plen_62_part_00
MRIVHRPDQRVDRCRGGSLVGAVSELGPNVCRSARGAVLGLGLDFRLEGKVGADSAISIGN